MMSNQDIYLRPLSSNLESVKKYLELLVSCMIDNETDEIPICKIDTTISKDYHETELRKINMVDEFNSPLYKMLAENPETIIVTAIRLYISERYSSDRLVCSLEFDDRYLQFVRSEVSGTPRDFLQRILVSLPKIFSVVHKSILNEELFSEWQRDSVVHYERKLEDLSEISKSLTKSIAESSKVITEHITEQETELRKKFSEKEDALEAKFSQKFEELTQEKEKLADRELEINDKEHSIVRRDLLKEIGKVINAQNEVRLSQATENKGWAVVSLAVMMLGVGMIATIGALTVIVPAKAMTPQTGIVLSSGLMITVSTFIYLLRWANARYTAHANREFFNKQFNADILRASWVAELVMEWQKSSSDKPIPEQLLQSFTTNLFQKDSMDSKEISHPYDDLLKMTNRFAKVKLAKGMVEIESKDSKEGKD